LRDDLRSFLWPDISLTEEPRKASSNLSWLHFVYERRRSISVGVSAVTTPFLLSAIGALALGLAVVVSVFADPIFRSDRAANSMAAGCLGLPLMFGGGACSLLGLIWVIRQWGEADLLTRVVCIGSPPAMLVIFLMAMVLSERRRARRSGASARIEQTAE
jgi:hypothetical protein